MGRKVARGSRGKSGVFEGRDGGALPTATSGRAHKSRGRSHGSPITPSRKREGSRENPLMPGLGIREDGGVGAKAGRCAGGSVG